MSKVTKILNTKAGAVAVGIVVVAGVGYYAMKKAKDAVAQTVSETAQAAYDANPVRVPAESFGSGLANLVHWFSGKTYINTTDPTQQSIDAARSTPTDGGSN